MSDPACTNTLQTNLQNQEEPEVNYEDTPQNDPFKSLPKSSMNLSLCKNDYFLSRENKENYFDNTFWTIFDPVGFSIHRGYYKYNDEFSIFDEFVEKNPKYWSSISDKHFNKLGHKYLSLYLYDIILGIKKII